MNTTDDFSTTIVELLMRRTHEMEDSFVRYFNKGFLMGRGPLFEPAMYSARRRIRRERAKRRLLMRGKKK